MSIEPQDVRASDVSFLPIIAAYVKKLGIVEQVDRLCPTMSDVSAGQVVMALILDTLAGRSPLYKLELSFVGQDTECFLVNRLLRPSSTTMLLDDPWSPCLR